MSSPLESKKIGESATERYGDCKGLGLRDRGYSILGWGHAPPQHPFLLPLEIASYILLLHRIDLPDPAENLLFMVMVCRAYCGQGS